MFATAAPLVPLALAGVVGVALGPALQAPPLACAGLGIAALASLPLAGRVAPLAAAAAFFALGLVRGVPVTVSTPEPEGELLWEIEIGWDSSRADVVTAWRSDGGPPPGQRLHRLPGSVRLLRWGWAELPGPRQRWLVPGQLLAPRGGDDEPALLRTGPARALAGGGRLAAAEGRAAVALERARGRVRGAIDSVAPPTSRDLLVALALSERRSLDDARRQTLARTGTSHLLAISGLHVGTAFLLALLGLRTVGRRLLLRATAVGLVDRLAVVAALLAASAWVALAGAPVSARRAIVMLGAAVLASLWDRPTARWNALALAALAVAWVDPGAATQPGFLLSVASVGSLVALGQLEPALRRVARPLRGFTATLAVSAVTAAATAPLVALWWGRVPVAALWSNLLAVPLLGTATTSPLVVAAAVGVLWPALARPLVAAAVVPAELGLAMLDALAVPARCPYPAWQPSAALVATSYLAIGCLLVLWRRRRFPLGDEP